MSQLGGAAKITDARCRRRHRRHDRAGGHRHHHHRTAGHHDGDLPGQLQRTVRPGGRSTVVDAMTGAPAIIAGLFVYLLWVAPHHTSGKSGFAAALALAVMMLPIVTRAAQEVVAIVPGSLREAALALGAPEWRVLAAGGAADGASRTDDGCHPRDRPHRRRDRARCCSTPAGSTGTTGTRSPGSRTTCPFGSTRTSSSLAGDPSERLGRLVRARLRRPHPVPHRPHAGKVVTRPATRLP